MKGKGPTISKLKKKLDKVFSLWIRNRDEGKCFTCPKKGEIKEMQAGHWVSRMHMSTRFDERNVNCQCVGCNIFKKGAMDVYALNLQTKYGDGILKELNALKNTTKQWTVGELEELIKKYSL